MLLTFYAKFTKPAEPKTSKLQADSRDYKFASVSKQEHFYKGRCKESPFYDSTPACFFLNLLLFLSTIPESSFGFISETSLPNQKCQLIRSTSKMDSDSIPELSYIVCRNLHFFIPAFSLFIIEIGISSYQIQYQEALTLSRLFHTYSHFVISLHAIICFQSSSMVHIIHDNFYPHALFQRALHVFFGCNNDDVHVNFLSRGDKNQDKNKRSTSIFNHRNLNSLATGFLQYLLRIPYAN
ncbi:hypothetical protein L5515_014148 [Caenorhabditis briggsae]|uniref:Uncharacterized protein n=1 Tax=Caenorhabditis briggsae TaxID=6238 RepID=A0AAE9J7V9_CAEBR|nr:hypothetical protein L5515_014148 [Caenorhabditis briggsae]